MNESNSRGLSKITQSESQWKVVSHRKKNENSKLKRSRKSVKVGTGDISKNSFQPSKLASEKELWLFISKVRNSEMEKDVAEYITERGNIEKEDVHVKELVNKSLIIIGTRVS